MYPCPVRFRSLSITKIWSLICGLRYCSFSYKIISQWTLSIIVDNILMLNCLVLSGLIVSEGLRKSSPNVTIFLWQNFSLNSIAYIYLLVSFYSVCFAVFMFICYQLWWINMFIYPLYFTVCPSFKQNKVKRSRKMCCILTAEVSWRRWWKIWNISLITALTSIFLSTFALSNEAATVYWVHTAIRTPSTSIY